MRDWAWRRCIFTRRERIRCLPRRSPRRGCAALRRPAGRLRRYGWGSGLGAPQLSSKQILRAESSSARCILLQPPNAASPPPNARRWQRMFELPGPQDPTRLCVCDLLPWAATEPCSSQSSGRRYSHASGTGSVRYLIITESLTAASGAAGSGAARARGTPIALRSRPASPTRSTPPSPQ